MNIEELIDRGFTLLDLVQVPGANITVADLEDAGVPADEIDVLKTTLADSDNSSGGSTGKTVVIVAAVLLVVVVLFLLYRRNNPKAMSLPEVLDAHVTENKAFDNPQYGAVHADGGSARDSMIEMIQNSVAYAVPLVDPAPLPVYAVPMEQPAGTTPVLTPVYALPMEQSSFSTEEVLVNAATAGSESVNCDVVLLTPNPIYKPHDGGSTAQLPSHLD